VHPEELAIKLHVHRRSADTEGRTTKSCWYVWESEHQTWEHLAVWAISLGQPQNTAEQYWKNNMFFGNAAAGPGNHSY